MEVQVSCNVSRLECGQLAVIIIPSLLAFSTLIIVSLILWRIILKKSPAPNSSTVSPHGNGLLPGPDALREWEMPANCILEEVEFLGNGRFGTTCKGQLKRDEITTAVVVKTLRGNSNSQERSLFVDLVLFYTMVSKHVNVVRMLHCQTRHMPMYLVLEASTPGNLLHFLWRLRDDSSGTSRLLPSFSERSVYLVAKQVASGLDYLLSEHRLVHGYVAACRMLIGSGLSVKVSGLSSAFDMRQAEMFGKEETSRIPRKWQAPERLIHLPTTFRSDVWSFGILLFELITLGEPPFPELDPAEIFPQTLASYKLKRPASCGGALFDLMKYCCMWNFKDRPAYSAIINLLEGYIHLADTKPLQAPAHMDPSEYKKRAGL